MNYSQFRTALLTFTIGLAGVPFSNAVYAKWTEIPVDVPQVMSDTPIILHIETEGYRFNTGGGGASGGSKEPPESACPKKKNKKPLSR